MSPGPNFATNLAEAVAREVRLKILRVLAQQTDGRLSDIMFKQYLDIYGYRRDRDWIRTQMRKLADLGAISLQESDEVMFARIEPAGRSHIEERSVIEGIMRPAEAQ